MVADIQRYMDHARSAFQALAGQSPFFGSKNFWQVGCTFDTILDYLLISGDDPGTIVADAYRRYTDTLNVSACWYDDYGWWGIVGARAFEPRFAGIFAGSTGPFQQLARDCWRVMYAGKPSAWHSYRGAPNVWENREGAGLPDNYFTQNATWAVPRVDGGVWQYELFYTPRDHECAPGLSNPSDPSKCNLGPFQNTVVNGLYLVLALRLQALDPVGVPEAGDAAQNVYRFLRTWFDIPLPDRQARDDDHVLLTRFDDGTALVRERVGTYAPIGDGTLREVERYDKNAAWCGDQGLILGGLVDYHALHPGDGDSEAIARMLAAGVAAHMSTNGVVQSHTPVWPAGDEDDYSSGVGVFMRYLLHAFRTNATVRDEVLTWLQSAPDGNVIAASAEVACTPGALSRTGNRLFDYFNVLASLTTAVAILSAADREA